MNKTAVVYQSKYGASKKYAQWIAEELSCDLYERKSVKAAELNVYDTIIYGGGLYAGGVSGIDLLTKNFDKFSNKNLLLFTCGLADTKDEENINNIQKSLSKVFTAEMQEKIKVFNLRGAIDYEKLGIVHKSMMAMLRRMLMKKDKESLNEENNEFLATYGKSVDFTDKVTIAPIIAYVKGL